MPSPDISYLFESAPSVQIIRMRNAQWVIPFLFKAFKTENKLTLPEAVLINPFDVTETAEAMETAMRMGRDERRNRMSLMRRTVKENNVYRWAGRMLMDAARIRQRQSLRSVSGPRRLGTWNR